MSQNDSIVREKQQHILVCLSSSPSNKRIIDEAANLAKCISCRIYSFICIKM